MFNCQESEVVSVMSLRAQRLSMLRQSTRVAGAFVFSIKCGIVLGREQCGVSMPRKPEVKKDSSNGERICVLQSMTTVFFYSQRQPGQRSMSQAREGLIQRPESATVDHDIISYYLI
jgi:hypothetical protein